MASIVGYAFRTENITSSMYNISRQSLKVVKEVNDEKLASV